ncbi:MAG: dephospho-CoA kinase [Bacillaceae bacterium]|nr:dephospho-CoA kinase [Bacillaceae bacterium]
MKKEPAVIGLTGGIACGKSTVVSMLEKKGACIIDADKLAREVVEPGEIALDEIRERFGDDVIKPDGQLDRPKLGQIVFSDPQARQDLNRIVHPRVHERMQERLEQARQKNCPLIIVDIPLLFENNRQNEFEKVIVVYARPDIQLARLMERDKLSKNDALNRIHSQMPVDEKKKRADFVIDNSGSLEETKKQVDELYKQLTT